jgi:hypothetical protein
LDVFGDANIRGAKAASQMRMALLQMAAPSPKAKAALKEIGLGPTQLAEDMRKPQGLLVALTTLKDHLKNVAPKDLPGVLRDMFGVKQSAGIFTMMSNLDALKAKYKAVEGGSKSFNKAWKDTQKDISVVWDKVKAFAEVVLIKLGGAISKFVQSKEFQKFAKEVGKVFQDIGKVAQAVWPVVSRIISISMKLIAVEVRVTAAIIKFSFNAIKTVVMALIPAAKWVGNAFVDAFNAIKGAVLWVWHNVLQPVANFVKGVFVGAFNGLKSVVQGLGGVFSTAFGVVMTVVNAALAPIRAMVDAVKWLEGDHTVAPHGPITTPWTPTGTPGAPPIIPGPGMATGGSVSRAGVYDVGERGRERVFLPAGAYVMSNAALNAAGSGDGQPLENHITLQIGPYQFAKAMAFSQTKVKATR